MIRTIMILVAVCAVAFSCGNKKKTDSTETSSQVSENKVAEEKKDSMESHPGKTLYQQHCGACHQMDGSGVPGMYPPLTESEYINGDVQWLVNIIVNGLEGPITVKGEEYDNLMPQMDYLEDQEIADILTFIRGSFGNSGGEVTADEVKEIKASLE